MKSRKLFVGSHDSQGVIGTWEVNYNDGEVKYLDHLPSKHGRSILSIVHDSDGEILFTGGVDGYIKLWNYSDIGSELISIGELEVRGKVTSLKYDADDQILFAGNEHGKVTVWKKREINKDEDKYEEGSDGKCISVEWIKISELRGHTRRIRDTWYDSKTQSLFTCSKDKTIQMWKFSESISSDKKMVGMSVFKHKEVVHYLAYDTNKSILVCGMSNGVMLKSISDDRQSVHDKETILKLPNITCVMYDVARSLLFCGHSKSISIWKLNNSSDYNMVHELTGLTSEVRILMYDPEGDILYTSSGTFSEPIAVWKNISTN